MSPGNALTAQELAAVQTLWDFHRLDHESRRTDVGIGLGGHDIAVATHTVELYLRGLFPLIAFTGATAPTTRDRFPRGEAIHFREHAIALGVPDNAIVVEPDASSTIQNISFVRRLLRQRGEEISSATFVSRPYQQRRAYGIASYLWPQIDVTCSAQLVELNDYLDQIGDVDLVVNTIVADTERLERDHAAGSAISQQLPGSVQRAYRRLVDAGYTMRIDTSQR